MTDRAMRVTRPSIHASSSGRVMVQSFAGRVEAADIREAFQLFHRMVAERCDVRHGALTLVTGSAHLLPTVALAREITDWNETVARHTSGSAIVIEGTGFAAVTARTAMSSVRLLSRYPFRERAFADRIEAIDWLAGHLDLDASERADVIACARDVTEAHHRALDADR